MTISITLSGMELTRVKSCFGKIFNHVDTNEDGKKPQEMLRKMK